MFISLGLSQNEYDGQIPETNSEEFVGFNKKNKDKKDLSRIKIGGSAGFGFANQTISLNISPLIGYQIVKDRLEIGTGIYYEYFKYNDRRFGYHFNTVGPNSYLRVYVWGGVFVQARGVYLVNYGKSVNGTKVRYDFGNVYGGAGYSIPLGERATMNVGLEINLIEYSPSYSNTKRIISPFFNFQYSL